MNFTVNLKRWAPDLGYHDTFLLLPFSFFLRWVVLSLKIREKWWVKSPVSQNRTQRRMRRWGGRVLERGKRGDISHMWFIYNSMLQLIWAGWRAPGLGPMPPERQRKSDPLLREWWANGSRSLRFDATHIIAQTKRSSSLPLMPTLVLRAPFVLFPSWDLETNPNQSRQNKARGAAVLL